MKPLAGTSDGIDVALADKRMTITIDRPGAGNRLDRDACKAIVAAVREAESARSVRAIVLTGAGDVFSLGGEPAGFRGRDIPAQLDYAESFIELIGLLRTVRKPILARVNGDAMAGGTSLIMASDIAIACEHCQLGFPEIDQGSFPMLALAANYGALPQKLAMEMFYTGRQLTADEALKSCLLNEVVPADALNAAIDGWVERLSQRRQDTIGMGRVGFYAMAGMSPEARLRYAQYMMTTVFSDLENESDGLGPATD